MYSRFFSLGLVLSATMAFAQGGIGPITTQVPKPNQDFGHPATKIAPGYRLRALAQGTDVLENPSGPITTFGRLSDDTATEPDQNLYLVFPTNPGGPVPGYDTGAEEDEPSK